MSRGEAISQIESFEVVEAIYRSVITPSHSYERSTPQETTSMFPEAYEWGHTPTEHTIVGDVDIETRENSALPEKKSCSVTENGILCVIRLGCSDERGNGRKEVRAYVTKSP